MLVIRRCSFFKLLIILEEVISQKFYLNIYGIYIYIYIDGRQPKPRISFFFKNTFISVFGRKYHSTQSVKKL